MGTDPACTAPSACTHPAARAFGPRHTEDRRRCPPRHVLRPAHPAEL